MPEHHHFNREEVFPSWFADAIQNFLSAARTDLRLSLKSASVIEVIPDEELGIAAIAIEGRWRWITAPIERNHPGGAKGTYVVWAVAEDNNVTNVPDPFTDHTDYAFDLRITSGAKPEGAGIAVVEKIGEIDWSGTEIEALRQTHGSITGPQIEDGALSGNGDITWTRDASGAFVPQFKKDSVGSNELADLSVDTAALIDLAVTEAKLAALAVTEGKLAPNSVATAKIIDLAVTAAKLAVGSVIEEKIGPEAVSTAKIKLLAITSALLANEAVTEGKIANFAVATSKLANFAVTAIKIAEAAVETSKIKDGAVTDAKLAKPPIGGRITSLGEILLGSGFTVARTKEGVYEVKLTTPAPTAVVGTANLLEQPGSVSIESLGVEGNLGLKFHTFDPAGVAGNRAFYFSMRAT